MFSSLVSSFASLISYTPYVFNQTLADGYWVNPNGGHILKSLDSVPAAEKAACHFMQWQVDSNPISFYANAVFVLYLLYAARSIYRHMRATPPQPLEKEMNWAGLVLFLASAARIACGWLLNLYYEGTLHGSHQELIVPSLANKMHPSLLVLYLPLLGLGFQYAMRAQEADERKAHRLPEPAPQPAWDGWRKELSTLRWLMAFGSTSLISLCSLGRGFRWLETADPTIGSIILISPFLAMVLWFCKEDIARFIQTTTWADIRSALFTVYKYSLWFIAIYSLNVSLWLYLAACAGLIYNNILAREHAKAA